MSNNNKHNLASRFGGYLPIVVDIETAGLNPQTDAILEIAAIITTYNEQNKLTTGEVLHCHVTPFPNANLDDEALKITGIDPYHPFRFAISEKETLDYLFDPIRKAVKSNHCQRAILVGHNSSFDLSFLQQAIKRCQYKRSPFHSFTTFDTATLSGLTLSKTVLASACKAANINFNADEAHSALYDAKRTAELFCYIVNRWDRLTTDAK